MVNMELFQNNNLSFLVNIFPLRTKDDHLSFSHNGTKDYHLKQQ